ncbi:MAG: hypothetical protein O6909_07770 [Alphaproteobacteria bacterium]|nr:hypothetical protein [Alphaproteobacteria bacterium]
MSAGTALVTPGWAGEADVVGVRMTENSGSYRLSVTVRHADAGWDHYADKWEVVTPDGKVIDTRVLSHPHDNEQPFTRSLGGVRIPAGLANVRIRAHDKVHGYGGREMEVDIKTGKAGPAGGES